MAVYIYPTQLIQEDNRSITQTKDLPLRKNCGSDLVSDYRCTFNYNKCQGDKTYYQPVCAPEWCACCKFDGVLGAKRPGNSAVTDNQHLYFGLTNWNMAFVTKWRFDLEIVYEVQNFADGVMLCLTNTLTGVATTEFKFGCTNTGALFFEYRTAGQVMRWVSDDCTLEAGKGYKVSLVKDSINVYHFEINDKPITTYHEPSTIFLNAYNNNNLLLVLGVNSLRTAAIISPFHGEICSLVVSKTLPAGEVVVQRTYFNCKSLPSVFWKSTILGTPVDDGTEPPPPVECPIPLPFTPVSNYALTDILTTEFPAPGAGTCYNPTYGSGVYMSGLTAESGVLPCGSYSGFPTFPEYDGTQPGYPTASTTFDLFLTNFVSYSTNNFWLPIYGGTMQYLGGGVVRYITNRTLWFNRFGVDICQTALKHCTPTFPPNLTPPCFTFTLLQNVCCDEILDYLEGQVISEVGVNAQIMFFVNNPFVKKFCDFICSDKRNCVEDDTLYFQFQIPDNLNDPNSFFTHGWSALMQGNWLCTAIIHDIDNPNIITPYSDVVTGAFVAYDNISQINIQQIKFNVAFMPCRFYIEFVFNMGDGCNRLRFFSEDYEKVECNNKTLLVEGTYKETGNGSLDCRKYFYGLPKSTYGTTPFLYRNIYRLRGSIEPDSVTIEKEVVSNYNFKRTVNSRNIETDLMRTDFLPPYAFERLVIAAMGRETYINGNEYIAIGDLSKNNDGGSMWSVDISFEKVSDCQTIDFLCD